MVILYNCCTMHNSTHSVHKRLWKVWRDRLLHLWPCCYVPSPPLSGANCQPFPPPVGPGPLASKMAPFSPGSTHTPFPLSVTIHVYVLLYMSEYSTCKYIDSYNICFKRGPQCSVNSAITGILISVISALIGILSSVNSALLGILILVNFCVHFRNSALTGAMPC